MISVPSSGGNLEIERLLYEWETIPCHSLLQPPSILTSSQHPLLSPAAVLSGYRSGGSRLAAESRASDFLVYL